MLIDKNKETRQMTYQLILILVLTSFVCIASAFGSPDSTALTPGEFASNVSPGEITETTIIGTQLALNLKSLWVDRPVTFSHRGKSYLIHRNMSGQYGNRTIWMGSSVDGDELAVTWGEGLKGIATFTTDGETSIAVPLGNSTNHVLMSNDQLSQLTDLSPLGISRRVLRRHHQLLALSSISSKDVDIGKRGIVSALAGKSLGRIANAQIEFNTFAKKSLMLAGTEEFTLVRDGRNGAETRLLVFKQSIGGIPVSTSVRVFADPDTNEVYRISGAVIPDIDLPRVGRDYVSEEEAKYLATEAVKQFIEAAHLDDVDLARVELAYKTDDEGQVNLVWLVVIGHSHGAHNVTINAATRHAEVKSRTRDATCKVTGSDTPITCTQPAGNADIVINDADGCVTNCGGTTETRHRAAKEFSETVRDEWSNIILQPAFSDWTIDIISDAPASGSRASVSAQGDYAIWTPDDLDLVDNSIIAHEMGHLYQPSTLMLASIVVIRWGAFSS